ncbi:MAG: hypothetical protein Fur002_16660 [Anaerolineales bacterium]
MTSRIPLAAHWLVTLLIGVFLGFSYQPSETTPSLPPVVLTLTPSPIPVDKFLYVRVKIYPNQSPEIENVAWTSTQDQENYAEGTNKIELLDGGGVILYSRSFAVKENYMPDLPQPDESQTLFFFLPDRTGAAEVVVTTSSGKDSHAIPSK